MAARESRGQGVVSPWPTALGVLLAAVTACHAGAADNSLPAARPSSAAWEPVHTGAFSVDTVTTVHDVAEGPTAC